MDQKRSRDGCVRGDGCWTMDAGRPTREGEDSLTVTFTDIITARQDTVLQASDDLVSSTPGRVLLEAGRIPK